jgi:hypothetical protein
MNENIGYMHGTVLIYASAVSNIFSPYNRGDQKYFFYPTAVSSKPYANLN